MIGNLRLSIQVRDYVHEAALPGRPGVGMGAGTQLDRLEYVRKHGFVQSLMWLPIGLSQ
jgi:hypothetical protein